MNSNYMFDTGANVHLYNIKARVWDVKNVENVTLNGVGNVLVSKSCIGIWGYGYLINELPFNIVSKVQLLDSGYDVEYDSDYDTFIIDSKWKFNRDPISGFNLLCETDADKLFDLTRLRTFPVLNADGSSFFNSTERKRAGEVKKIHDILNHPSDVVLESFFDNNCVAGSPYTSKDVQNMRRIYGDCQSCIKGKSTNVPASDSIFTRDYASSPGEILSIDICFMAIYNQSGKRTLLPFLVSTCYFSGYCMAKKLSDKSLNSVKNALQEMLLKYRRFGWYTRKIFADREKVLTTLTPFLDAYMPRISLEQAGTDTHSKLVERFVRTIKEKIRTVKTSLWYQCPQIFLPYLFLDCVTIQNCLPNSRLLAQRSPRQVVEQCKLEYKSHLHSEFGTVGEFRVPKMKVNNPMEERTATGIVVGRNLDENGTLTVFLLQSLKIVNRARVVRILLPNPELRTLIERINTSENSIGDSELLFRGEAAHGGGTTQPPPSLLPTHSNQPPSFLPTHSNQNDAVESDQLDEDDGLNLQSEPHNEEDNQSQNDNSDGDISSDIIPTTSTCVETNEPPSQRSHSEICELLPSSKPSVPQRSSTRLKNSTKDLKNFVYNTVEDNEFRTNLEFIAFHLTLVELEEKYPDNFIEPVNAELRNIYEKGVANQVHDEESEA